MSIFKRFTSIFKQNKSSPFLQGNPFSPFSSGFTYQNADIAVSPEGFAVAFNTVTAVNRAINLRADAIDALIWQIVNTKTGDVLCTSKDAPNHPLAKAIKDYRSTTGRPFFKLMQAYYDIYGEVYIEKARNPYGRGGGFKILNILAMQVYTANGRILWYQYSGGTNGDTPTTYTVEEIAYDHSFNPFDDMRGQSAILPAMSTINIDRNLERFLRDFFRNNARPSVIVSPRNEMDKFSPYQQEEVKRQLVDFFKGSGQQYGTWVSSIPVDMTLAEMPDIGRQYSIADPITRKIFVAFGVPLAMAGDSSSSAYKDGQEVMDAFYINTILPLAENWVEFINAQLMPFVDPTGMYRFEFDTSRFNKVSDDDLKRLQVARDAYQSGLWTLNEARQYVKSDPMPNGDMFLVSPPPIDIAPPAPLPTLSIEPIKADYKLARGVLAESHDHEHTHEPELSDDEWLESLYAHVYEQQPVIGYSELQSELKAWRNYALKKVGKSNTRAFEPRYTRGDMGDYLTHALKECNDVDAIERAFNDVQALYPVIDAFGEFETVIRAYIANDVDALESALKGIGNIEMEFAGKFDAVLYEMRNGGIDNRRRAGDIIRQLIRVHGSRAFRQGLVEGGVWSDELSDEDTASIERLNKDASGYVSNFTNEVMNIGITDAQASQRAKLWVNKTLMPFYQEGLASADKDGMYEWVEGDTIEKCRTCLTMDGQRHRLKDYVKRRIMPQGSLLACKGFQCKCELKRVNAKARGSWI